LEELDKVRLDPHADPSLALLREALESKMNHLIAAAARLVGDHEIKVLENQLVQTFMRLSIKPAKRDPGCSAKASIAESLYRLGSHQDDLFLKGIHFKQLEPTYRGSEDTAAPVRVASAFGLVRTKYPDVLVELAHLLADKEVEARIGAVQAIEGTQQREGIPLLRFKALIGDTDPRVMYECFLALLSLSPEPSLSFVSGFLKNESEPIRESAVLAIGESGAPGAFERLQSVWEGSFTYSLRRSALLAIAMLRTEEAISFLLTLVEEAAPTDAKEAIAALEMYRHDDQLWRRVVRLASSRQDVDIRD
jgi:HEAT repeat protein